MYASIGTVINLSLDPKPKGEAGTAVTIKIPKPNEEARVKKEQDFQTTFIDAGSYLVMGVRPVLERLITEHKKELTTYNKKLGRAKIPIRIRLTHTVTRRGSKYVYCGRYIYTKDNKYIGLMDNAVLREQLREKWSSALMPPRNPLEGLKYKIFMANGLETDNIVIPFELLHNPMFFHIFQKYTRVRLGGM